MQSKGIGTRQQKLYLPSSGELLGLFREKKYEKENQDGQRKNLPSKEKEGLWHEDKNVRYAEVRKF